MRMTVAVLVLVVCAGLSAKEEEPHASKRAYPGVAVIQADDAASGRSYKVSENGTELVAYGKDGAKIWSQNLKPGKVVGTPVIRHVEVRGGEVWATIGKHHFVKIDGASGKVIEVIAD